MYTDRLKIMEFKFLIWGGSGWIGSMVCEILQNQGHTVILAKSRLQDYIGICKELEETKPDFVLNAAGITGRPTIDWCEDHKQETYLVNTIGPMNLAHACWEREQLHMTNFSTGCIYTYDEAHPIGTKFKESDKHNFRGSIYSHSKLRTEKLLAIYPNVLTLRIRLPIGKDLNPKSLVTKLSKYAKVVNIPNSVTVLPEMLPISIKMAQAKLTGVYNFTNPGAISHNEILALYKKHINPDFTWNNFTEEEQNAILKSKRSNCELDTSKLEAFHPVTEVHEALDKLLEKLAIKLKTV